MVFAFAKSLADLCILVCVGASLEPAEIKMGSQGDSKTRCEQPLLKMWE